MRFILLIIFSCMLGVVIGCGIRTRPADMTPLTKQKHSDKCLTCDGEGLVMTKAASPTNTGIPGVLGPGRTMYLRTPTRCDSCGGTGKAK
jgi:DnaJ-class molecular chaperone